MKLVILLGVLTFVCADKLDRTYLPPSSAQTAGGSGTFLETPNFSRTEGRLSQEHGSSNQFRNGNQPAHGNNFQGNQYNGPSNERFGQANNFAGRVPTASGLDSNDGVVINSALNQFSHEENRPERPQAAFERTAGILRQDSELKGDSYTYSYETENGIFAEESGVATNGVEAQGGFSYTGDDGKIYSITYTADENGFVPHGDHLPTPPPIPEEILRALEQNAADEAAGIFDDGTYDAIKYQGNDFQSHNFNGKGQRSDQGSDDSIVTNSAAYLPPFSGSVGQRQDQANQRSRFRGSNPANQIGSEENFAPKARQPSFNSNDGYQY